jgi:hypothetical protein
LKSVLKNLQFFSEFFLRIFIISKNTYPPSRIRSPILSQNFEMTPTNLFAKKGWLTPLGLLGGHTEGGLGGGMVTGRFSYRYEKMRRVRKMRKV